MRGGLHENEIQTHERFRISLFVSDKTQQARVDNKAVITLFISDETQHARVENKAVIALFIRKLCFVLINSVILNL